MKMLCCTLLVMLLCFTSAMAQVPRVELGYSVGVGFKRGENDMSVPFAFRCGIHLGKGFVVEPEIASSVSPFDGEKMFYYGTDFFGANLHYNFTPKSSWSPFILAGYGVSGREGGSGSKKWYHVPEFGAGLNFFFDRFSSMRIEYRYRRYPQEGYVETFGNPVYMSITHQEGADEFDALMIGFAWTL